MAPGQQDPVPLTPRTGGGKRRRRMALSAAGLSQRHTTT